MSNIHILRSNKRKDPTGLLAKKIIIPDGVVKVYQLAPTSEFAVVTINVVNPSDQENAFSIWVAHKDKEPTLIDVIEPQVTVQAYDVFTRTDFIMSRDEAIYIQAHTQQVVVRIDGLENVLPY